MIFEDHFASDAINAGIAAQAGFVKSFDGEGVAELGDLRAQFLRKADDSRAGVSPFRCPILAEFGENFINIPPQKQSSTV